MNKIKRNGIVCAFAAAVTAAAVGAAFAVPDRAEAEMPSSDHVYNELYRDQMSFSPKYGWNNDPNGLIYADGVYHMYYQYNYDRNKDKTENVWGNMSWGHATSGDLVHWTEKSVALPAYVNGDDGKYYAMMFSGSAVFDENNTSGLFETEGDGSVKAGQGIVALLTQPSDEDGGQRQILAYSKDGGDSFNVYGEVLGADEDGGSGDGEFRDPKVFWSEDHGKWLMAVGGGAVRMYASDDLKSWNYLGDTGYWGECPDISRYTVGGETKYVLVMSPEDKPQSHAHNGTTRQTAYYPAEYYVVGDLDADGLFIGETPLSRLSQGIDSYAFQSFNGSHDGKVYGISWAASWKTVGEYERLRENFNGGMTVACEIGLTKTQDGYRLTRDPVAAFDSLRGERIADCDGILEQGKNAFAEKHLTVGDIELTLDFTESDAKKAALALRASDTEKTVITYDADTETLSLDRSESSLAAKGTSLYGLVSNAAVRLVDGKLDLRILLDRASVSVFANGGEASIFSAVFPSVQSDGISLTADGDIKLSAAVYKTESIFGALPENDTLYISGEKYSDNGETRYKLNAVMDKEAVFTASALADGFKNSDVEYTVVEGENFIDPELITVEKHDTYTSVTVNDIGRAVINASYNGKTVPIDIFVYGDWYSGDVEYTVKQNGESYYSDDGLMLSANGTFDAFLFSYSYAENFTYSATVMPADEDAQAGALVFGAVNDFYDYYVATVDYVANKLKLWRAGVGDIAVCDAYLENGMAYTLNVEVQNGVAKLYISEYSSVQLVSPLDGYSGGYVGLNVYNGDISFSDVYLSEIPDASEATGDVFVGDREILGVINMTDTNAVVGETNYSVENGFLSVSDEYMLTLPGSTEYKFKVVTPRDELVFTKATAFERVNAERVEKETGKGFTVVLDGAAQVLRVLVGETEVEFSQDGNNVTVPEWALTEVGEGKYYVTVYTDRGRTDAPLDLRHIYWTQPNLAVIIPVAVLSALIVAAAIALFVILYRKKNKETLLAESNAVESEQGDAESMQNTAESEQSDADAEK